ncbi:MAG: hypothetical protein OXI83_03710, partial [Gemmatimonadota bacterium]|nr:hypothetical protein [Gemmatimonadota bacterium]
MRVIGGDVERLTAASSAGAADFCSSAEAEAGEARTLRRRLAAVWVGACSAVAAMVAVSWYVVARNGGAPGGDMVGHAAAAEGLRTLPYWD